LVAISSAAAMNCTTGAGAPAGAVAVPSAFSGHRRRRRRGHAVGGWRGGQGIATGRGRRRRDGPLGGPALGEHPIGERAQQPLLATREPAVDAQPVGDLELPRHGRGLRPVGPVDADRLAGHAVQQHLHGAYVAAVRAGNQRAQADRRGLGRRGDRASGQDAQEDEPSGAHGRRR
jgi:hypothetical protein